MYIILGAIILILGLIAVSEFRNKKNSKHSSGVSEKTDEKVNGHIIHIPVEIMDNVFERSAGRFCSHCEIYGSHHSDRHNIFASYALEKFNSTRNIHTS